MAFEIKQWLDRIVANPTRRTLTDTTTGTTTTVDVARAEGDVTQEGTPLGAVTFNDLESRIATAFQNTDSILDNKLDSSLANISEEGNTAIKAITDYSNTVRFSEVWGSKRYPEEDGIHFKRLENGQLDTNQYHYHWDISVPPNATKIKVKWVSGGVSSAVNPVLVFMNGNTVTGYVNWTNEEKDVDYIYSIPANSTVVTINANVSTGWHIEHSFSSYILDEKGNLAINRMFEKIADMTLTEDTTILTIGNTTTNRLNLNRVKVIIQYPTLAANRSANFGINEYGNNIFGSLGGFMQSNSTRIIDIDVSKGLSSVSSVIAPTLNLNSGYSSIAYSSIGAESYIGNEIYQLRFASEAQFPIGTKFIIYGIKRG